MLNLSAVVPLTVFLIDRHESAPTDLQHSDVIATADMTKSMKVRTTLLCSTVVAASLMVVGVAPGYAKGAKCACDSGSVTHMGSDGSECAATCNGKHAGSATSSAVGDGSDASAAAMFRGQAKAKASNGGNASCIAQPGNASAIASDVGSNAQVDTVGGTGKATAMSGGNATANTSVFNGSCTVISTASNGGTTTNDCSGHKSRAEGVADDGGNAHAESSGVSCGATANATGDSSDAEAYCSNHGTKVTATASGGGVAIGSDTEPPQCMPNGGSAMVTSPEGDCP